METASTFTNSCPISGALKLQWAKAKAQRESKAACYFLVSPFPLMSERCQKEPEDARKSIAHPLKCSSYLACHLGVFCFELFLKCKPQHWFVLIIY